jgi:hypothetical protein
MVAHFAFLWEGLLQEKFSARGAPGLALAQATCGRSGGPR